ncbi:MAG: hypothetical protein EBS29_05415 [Chloroflexia bacterium]|nr:hypothetical protein [Chloroflexia bacterium]
MKFFSNARWRYIGIVFAYSMVLFLVMSSQRAGQVVDFYQPRTVFWLSDFHAREFTPIAPTFSLAITANGPSEASATVADAIDPRTRVIMFSTDPLPQAYKRRLLTVFVGTSRILDVNDTGRTTQYSVIIPPTVTIAGKTIRVVSLPDEKVTPPPLTVTSIQISNAIIYRWSQAQSQIRIYGTGGGWWSLSGRILIQHPDKKPFQATIAVGDIPIAKLPSEPAEFRRYHLLVPPHAMQNGDLTVNITSETWGGNKQDARVLGVAVSAVDAQPLRSPWWNIAPSIRLGSMVILAVIATLSALLLGFSGIGVGVAVATGLGIALGLDHTYLAMWYPQLVVLMGLSVCIIPLMQRIFTWCEGDYPLHQNVRNLLIGLMIVTMWVKGGGILFPIMRPLDISWHMDKVREMLSTGDIAKFYQPGGFSESVMPITEWGENRPMIPYSPFYHLSSLAFAIFPWPLEKTATILNVFCDATRIALIGIMVRQSGLSNRIALLAGLLYAVTPVTFLLHSWGNAPTTIGLWWTLVSTVALLVIGRSINNRKLFALLLIINTVTMLIYTVTAVFHVLFITLLAGLLWIIPNQPLRSSIRPILLATYGGLAVATIIYYGQYIPPIIERTIPYFLQVSVNSPATVGVARPALGTYFYNFLPLLRYDFVLNPYLYYGLFMPILLVIPGYLLLFKRQTLWVTMTAWFIVALLFMLAGYRISMVDKQIFYILPIVMICWAVVADQFWRRGWSGRLMVVIMMLYTLVSALYLWVVRIYRSPVVLP